ncbi:patatin-like phospholipase family protein [Hoeflea sp. YIM 152468]|uniref:patatin-like phospholipase family protein n=1 Tax=Hoeflea sp. YIM 152468 TaxID=3031759 RepID=UPI0023D99960|nr:patatin-like phospholipase family protein [Hoeflea sp. YIM 152468]MDF1608987.1 patatin-like phospholipase family protein [Hoeflea sp. YIM 152468]
MRAAPQAPTALVLAGGGSLGAVQVGMLLALVEAGLDTSFVIGSSVGALNAAYFAGDPDIAGVRRLADIWCGLRRADIFPFSLSTLIGGLGRSNGIVDPSNLRHLIEAHLAFDRIEQARLPLHIMSTDHQGFGVRLSQGPVVEAILASSAVPGIFPPVVIAGRPLIDGAIAANTPLRVAAGLGARRIVVLPTGYACALQKPPQGAIASMLHAVTLLVARQLMHEIETMPPDVSVYLAPTLCPLAVSPYDFTASRALIERAYRGTIAWVRKGGLNRPARACELAVHHHHGGQDQERA